MREAQIPWHCGQVKGATGEVRAVGLSIRRLRFFCAALSVKYTQEKYPLDVGRTRTFPFSSLSKGKEEIKSTVELG